MSEPATLTRGTSQAPHMCSPVATACYHKILTRVELDAVDAALVTCVAQKTTPTFNPPDTGSPISRCCTKKGPATCAPNSYVPETVSVALELSDKGTEQVVQLE